MLGSTIFYQEKKKSPVAKLSLIALMDIFTILVFFLLLNSGEAEKIQNAKFIRLPDSGIGTTPHKEVTVLLGENEIWFADEFVVNVADMTVTDDNTIELLSIAMAEHVAKRTQLTEFEQKSGLSVTILGDQAVPYSLIKSVMETCQENNFRNISLAVNHVIGDLHPSFNSVAANVGGGR